MDNNKFYETLGRRIESLRKKHDWSAEDLGNRINKTKKTVRRYELGQVKITHDMIEKIANVFEVPLSHFYADALEEDNKNKDYNEPTKALAAHIREDATEEEIKEIQRFIDYTFSNRNK